MSPSSDPPSEVCSAGGRITSQKISGIATVSLVWGVLGFLVAGLAGIVGILLGLVALSRISESNGLLRGKGRATAGIVLGVTQILVFGAALYILREAPAYSKLALVEPDCRGLLTALEMYKFRMGNYPTEEQGFAAMVIKPKVGPGLDKWKQLMDHVPEDPWGKPYFFRLSGKETLKKPQVASSGPDRLKGTEDDLVYE